MPRKPRAPVADPNDSVDTELLAKSAASLDAQASRLRLVEAALGEDEPYDLEHSVHICRAMMELATKGMLELGRQLIRIKENEPHGDFRDIVENRLGLSYNTARRTMTAAVKFLDAGARSQLANRLDRSKLLELMVEADEDLDALAEGGTVAGLELDEVERMTARELRAALREARQARADESAATNRLLESKNKKIDELDAALHKKHTAPWFEHAAVLGEETYIQAHECMRAIAQFTASLQALHSDEVMQHEDGQRAIAHLFMRFGQFVLGETEDLQRALADEIAPIAIRYMPTTEEGRALMRRFDAITFHEVDPAQE